MEKTKVSTIEQIIPRVYSAMQDQNRPMAILSTWNAVDTPTQNLTRVNLCVEHIKRAGLEAMLVDGYWASDKSHETAIVVFGQRFDPNTPNVELTAQQKANIEVDYVSNFTTYSTIGVSSKKVGDEWVWKYWIDSRLAFSTKFAKKILTIAKELDVISSTIRITDTLNQRVKTQLKPTEQSFITTYGSIANPFNRMADGWDVLFLKEVDGRLFSSSTWGKLDKISYSQKTIESQRGLAAPAEALTENEEFVLVGERDSPNTFTRWMSLF